nr:HD domain-containing phosphohydrolase [uncultured Vibrio sp.]
MDISTAKILLKEMMLLAWEVEAWEPHTFDHLWRVSKFTHLTATALDWPTLDIAKATLGAFLHDIGKLHIPLNILNKPGALTYNEYLIIQGHSLQGYKLIKDNPLAHFVADTILQHHERVDGRGYPKGLNNNAISKHAKLVSLCDAFDAMTSHRPYRDPMSKEKALDIIQSLLGTQFDSKLGTTFIHLGKLGKFDHIILQSNKRIPLQYCSTCGTTIKVIQHQIKGDVTQCRVCGSPCTMQNTILNKNDIWKTKHVTDELIEATVNHLFFQK